MESSAVSGQLDDLRMHWGMQHGGPYDIRIEGGAWNARFWNEPQAALRAGTADGLRQMIRHDYERRTAPRHLVAVP